MTEVVAQAGSVTNPQGPANGLADAIPRIISRDSTSGMSLSIKTVLPVASVTVADDLNGGRENRDRFPRLDKFA
jgi:hypothetical protein